MLMAVLVHMAVGMVGAKTVAIIIGRLRRALTHLAPQRGGTDHGEEKQDSAAAENELVKLAREHHLQHVGIQKVQRETNPAESRGQSDQAKLIQIIRVAVFVNLSHGKAPLRTKVRTRACSTTLGRLGISGIGVPYLRTPQEMAA